jgi:glutathione synthase/RimK-type ligase-like ATP-grasp enzyme
MSELCGYKIRRLFTDRPNPTFKEHPWTVYINWGNSNLEVGEGKKTINNPANVAVASNKLSTFNALKDVDGIRIPVYTTDRAVATSWLAEKITVVCRTVLSGHSGAGIVLADTEDKLVRAPLYVQYIKKQKEFRIHVAFGEVIDVQEKRKRKDLPEDFKADFQVRNHQTGWVYCREDITEPEGMRQMAQRVVAQLNLDFGAVDIIWNEKRNECYCLEVNTAPGLEGSTVGNYAQAFVRHLK